MKNLHLTTIVILTFLLFSGNSHSQYKYKIIVDANQIWKDELPNAHKIKCDGIWSIPGNSAGNKGRDIPISEWQTGYNLMKSDYLITEDYWINYPEKNYDLTKDILGESTIDLICLYAEPSKPVDNHISTVVNDDLINNVFTDKNKKVIVLSRAYNGYPWKGDVNRALANENVAGVCFEQKPDVNKYKQFKILDGIKATLNANKMVFLLLPPNFSSVSNNYSLDIQKIFNYLRNNAPEVLSDSNLFFVPNCYNRLKDKETTMYGEANSVEGAINLLSNLREAGPSNTEINTENSFTIYPNPAINQFTIGGLLPNEVISIFNMHGKLVYQSTNNENKLIVNCSQFNKGMYFVSCSQSNMKKLLIIQ